MPSSLHRNSTVLQSQCWCFPPTLEVLEVLKLYCRWKTPTMAEWIPAFAGMTKNPTFCVGFFSLNHF